VIGCFSVRCSALVIAAQISEAFLLNADEVID
jgi:hypothetical protein